jgi:hypothetical protein
MLLLLPAIFNYFQLLPATLIDNLNAFITPSYFQLLSTTLSYFQLF